MVKAMKWAREGRARFIWSCKFTSQHTCKRDKIIAPGNEKKNEHVMYIGSSKVFRSGEPCSVGDYQTDWEAQFIWDWICM